MAAGLSLVYGVLGVFNMALGQCALVGGYAAWWLSTHAGAPLFLAVPFGIFIGGLITMVTFEAAVAPFYRRHHFMPLVTTIAASMILDGLILMIFQEDPKSLSVGSRHLLRVGSAIISVEQVTLIACTIVFLTVLAWVLIATSFGRRIRATVQNPAAAQSLGMNASRLHRIIFLLSGTLAACAGIYQAIDVNLTPTLGFSITIKAYAALIAGGKSSIRGTILCAYAIALLEQLAVGIPWLGFYIPSGYQSTVALAIIILMLLLKPEGLFGSRLRRT